MKAKIKIKIKSKVYYSIFNQDQSVPAARAELLTTLVQAA